MYWLGKSPRVRKAVEDYLGSDVSVKDVAKKHGVSIVAVSNHAKVLRYFYHKGYINLPEILANTNDSKRSKSS
jgi:predicted DNA-binding protein YlxM (UPF0122 family)